MEAAKNHFTSLERASVLGTCKYLPLRNAKAKFGTWERKPYNVKKAAIKERGSANLIM